MAFKEKADGIGYYSSTRMHGTWTEANKQYRERTRTVHNHEKGYSVCSENCNPDPIPLSLDWDKSQYNIKATTKYGRNACGLLFHPAPDHSLLASFRLVATRDGIEDFEYFKMLEKLSNGKHPLLKIPDSLVSMDGYTKKPAELQAYRDQVAQAIEALQAGKQR